MGAIDLSFEADASDGLARGYPNLISLSNATVEQWLPQESTVEARTLRAASDTDGPAIHGRVRSLVTEEIVLLLDDVSVIEQVSRLLNAINAVK